jgi:response regulator RpfG family c-di-GMP phosphodiesterase
MDINFKSTILVADGAPDNLMLMKELLQPRLPDMDAASALHGLRGDFLAAAGDADEARQAWRGGAAEYRLAERTGEAERMQGATILAMATLAEPHDPGTGNHLRRTQLAFELIRQGRGEHFDPDIVDAMLFIEARFRAIAAEFPGAG